MRFFVLRCFRKFSHPASPDHNHVPDLTRQLALPRSSNSVCLNQNSSPALQCWHFRSQLRSRYLSRLSNQKPDGYPKTVSLLNPLPTSSKSLSLGHSILCTHSSLSLPSQLTVPVSMCCFPESSHGLLTAPLYWVSPPPITIILMKQSWSHRSSIQTLQWPPTVYRMMFQVQSGVCNPLQCSLSNLSSLCLTLNPLPQSNGPTCTSQHTSLPPIFWPLLGQLSPGWNSPVFLPPAKYTLCVDPPSPWKPLLTPLPEGRTGQPAPWAPGQTFSHGIYIITLTYNATVSSWKARIGILSFQPQCLAVPPDTQEFNKYWLNVWMLRWWHSNSSKTVFLYHSYALLLAAYDVNCLLVHL